MPMSGRPPRLHDQPNGTNRALDALASARAQQLRDLFVEKTFNANFSTAETERLLNVSAV